MATSIIPKPLQSKMYRNSRYGNNLGDWWITVKAVGSGLLFLNCSVTTPSSDYGSVTARITNSSGGILTEGRLRTTGHTGYSNGTNASLLIPVNDGDVYKMMMNSTWSGGNTYQYTVTAIGCDVVIT